MRYVGTVLAFTAAMLLAIGATIWTLDPQHRMILNEVNLSEITDPNLAWQVKPFLAKQYPHDAIMIGSSRLFYIDPTAISGFRFFNSAQPYMNPQRIYAYLEREAFDVRMVVIGLDFDMFSGAPGPTLDTDPFLIPLLRAFPREEIPRTYLIRRAMKVARLVHDNASYLINGASFLDALTLAMTPDSKKEKRQEAILPAGNMNLAEALYGQSLGPRPRQIAEEPFNKHLDECCKFKDFFYNPAWVEYLKRIKSLLDQRGIRLVVLITPLHERVLARIASDGKERELNQFRRDVCSVFPDAFDVSTGVYSNFLKFFDWDPIHFLPDVGAEIINKAMDGSLPRCSVNSADR